MTDDLSIHIIEIPKFLKDVDSLQNSLEDWVYLLKEANHLKGDKMKTLTKKNPKIKKAMNELKFVSHDKKSRESYEARLKTEMDYSARFKYQLEQMKVEGKIETANELLAWGMKREQICKITGLKDSDF